MGLKNWFAKNVGGAGAYGDVMGREAAKNGLALGRTLFLGHGTLSGYSGVCVFEDYESMVAQGFKPYCADPAQRPPVEDASKLSTLTRTAGVAFAAKLALQAAHQCFANLENEGKFNRSNGASCMSYLRENSPDIAPELLLQFVHMKLPQGTPLVDYEKPGTGDLFGAFLKSIVEQNAGPSIGFQRRGILGFDTWVVELSRQTIAVMQKAVRDFRW